MSKSLLETIHERPLLSDGAMGTELMRAGLEQGGCGEEWNLTHPEAVLGILRGYVEAGSDCITTNTFGANRIMLARHGLADRIEAINEAAVQLAREAFGDRTGFVLGDMGPFGGLMEPYGEFKEANVLSSYEAQAAALVGAGVDAIIIETMTSLDELGLAVAAARAAGAPCVIGSLAYDLTLDGTTFRTMMGIDPEHAAGFMEEHGVDIVALNCGTGMDMPHAAEAVRRYRAATDRPVMVQPNAGKPRLENLRVVYDETPEEMTRGIVPLLEAGARIIGGCCGSTPAHIRAFRSALDLYLAQPA